MLMLLLTMALMVIFAAIIVPSVTFNIKRDREEEMVHRGVQYSRAIRAYYKKFNRYPMKIEDLENSNQMRFLRKRYKDPLTGKDFKLLHFGEAKMSMNALGGAGLAGAAALAQSGKLNTAGGLGQVSAALGAAAAIGATANSPFGQNPQAPDQTATGTPTGTDPNSQNSSDPSNPNSPAPGNNLNGNSGDKLSNTTFGGAPIVGVASLSKERTIREFDKKKKYDEWQFVYDPTFDRGFLITTPYQPSLQQFGMQGTTNLNGPNGQTGQPGTNNGFGNSFGNSPSPMQNPTSPVGGYGNPSPSQPQNPPQQQ
jgi:type II secretory pathway pseudopilin PulG